MSIQMPEIPWCFRGRSFFCTAFWSSFYHLWLVVYKKRVVSDVAWKLPAGAIPTCSLNIDRKRLKSFEKKHASFVFFAKQLGVGKISGRKALQSGYAVVVGTFETSPITGYTSKKNPSKSHEIDSFGKPVDVQWRQASKMGLEKYHQPSQVHSQWVL